MARTKYTGPDPKLPEISPPTEAADDEATNLSTASAEVPASTSAAKPTAPAQSRVAKRVRGATRSHFSKDVLVLYEALTYGVNVKVSINS